MASPDELIRRVNAWLAHSGTPLTVAARAAKVAENTAINVLKGRKGRIETLRRLVKIVPEDFQPPAETVEEDAA